MRKRRLEVSGAPGEPTRLTPGACEVTRESRASLKNASPCLRRRPAYRSRLRTSAARRSLASTRVPSLSRSTSTPSSAP